MSLPVELLEIIFKFCYLGCQWDAYGDYVWNNPSLSDTLRNFPYNLAAVDPSWNAILLRHRKYWIGLSRMVVSVDSKTPIHIDDAKTLLQYMLDERNTYTYIYGFHVAIIRRSKANPDDAAEKERVRNLMDLLVPHIQLIQSFVIDVHASSSLPSVTTYFNNLITSPLVSFEYLCDVDNSDDVVFHEPYGLPINPSKIKSMVLDGFTFRRNISWLRQHAFLKSLTISHLPHVATDRARGIENVHQALEALCSMVTAKSWGALPHLKYLKFRDINFAPPDSMLRAFMRVPINNRNFQYLSFEDLDREFLEDLTRSIYLNTLSHPAPMELHLPGSASISDDVQTWKYARLALEGHDQAFITSRYPFNQVSFPSSELHLRSCPGFSDSELEILSRVDPETQDPLFSTNLTYLKLTDCHNFTVQALKDMVTARAMGWRTGSRMAGWKSRRLVSLEVTGYGAPLSDKDNDWFRTHLKYFSWDGVLFSSFY
jgi:hypothetical protein